MKKELVILDPFTFIKSPKVTLTMERAGILINKLQEQLSQKADAKNMLVTVQMLQAELLQYVTQNVQDASTSVNIMVAFNPGVRNETVATNGIKIPAPGSEQEELKQEKKPELPVSEKEEQPPQPGAFNFQRNDPPGWSLSPVEVPTLAHQEKIGRELNDTMLAEIGSLNESLKESTSEIAANLREVPIKDLKKAISINDRHRFIHDLFRDDETMYERSIKTINSFYIFAEAEYWIQRELKLKLGWDFNNETVKSFDQLVKRRFS